MVKLDKENIIKYINHTVSNLIENYNSTDQKFERVKRMVYGEIDVKVELNKDNFYAIVKDNNKEKVEFYDVDEFMNYSY